MAKKYDAVFVDTQFAFDDFIDRGGDSMQLCWDRIHPNMSGHMLLARAWIKANGLEIFV